MERIRNPKVSVITCTYGHEKYIAETLQGVLMQQYDGTVEFIIADDHSPDNTKEVIKNYFKEHPAPENFEIKYTQHDKNKGINPNFIWALEQASGKYIALCEGDDYWLDPLKLKKQVQVLESNPTIKICSHPSKRKYGDLLKDENYGYWGTDAKIISAQEVISNYSATAPFQTIMFRNEGIADLTLILEQLIGSHSTIQMFYALNHGLFYLPDYMSVYRVESVSSISKTLFKNDSNYLKRQLVNWKNIDLLNSYSQFQFDEEFKKLKREKALSAINTGYLTLRQKLFLIYNYHLYRETTLTMNILKSEIYIYYKKLQKIFNRKSL